MRLHRLEVEGFGPFRERQFVDFDAFAGDGIFLIAGRTGAGKSSILDAVCFALYGGVPRYDGGDKRLRSDHCAPDDRSEVVVEFSTTAGRFRVTRSPEYLRPAKRGGGMTKQVSAVALDEWVDAGWVGRAARAVDVGHELDEILQLSREQFLQVILLAQNRFSEFLLANSKDRQALLRRLFGTERFEDVQARFEERRRASERALDARLATVAAGVEQAERLVTEADLWGSADRAGGADADDFVPPPVVTTADRLTALERALARADYRAERSVAERDAAEQALNAADAALVDVKEQVLAQIERDRARSALAAFDREQPQIDEARQELAAARSAESLRAVIEAASRADAAERAAESVADAARTAWAGRGVTVDHESAEALRAWASERTRESGAWQRAAQLEASMATRAAEREAAQGAADAASAVITRIDQERADLPAVVERLTVAREEARREADRVGDHARGRDLAAVRLEAVREATRLAIEAAAAQRELAAASTALAAAQTTLATLRQRRLDGYAGELAAALAEGDLCPVCGSVEHPQPATHSDPVSADDVDAAQAARDVAGEREREISALISTLNADAAAAAAVADGRSLTVAEQELEAVTLALTAAEAAAEVAATVDAELVAATAQAARLEQERADAALEVVRTRETVAALEQSMREATALITDARGDAESVDARLAAATAEIAAASALASALDELRQRTGARADTVAARDAALAASPFDCASDVAGALRSDAAQSALDERITGHSVQREKEKAVLLPLEMRALPETRIEIGPVEIAAASARATWMTAVDLAGRVGATAEHLRALIASAAAEHARIADDAADHEVLQGLADTLAGRGANTHKMTLETFVLAAELEEIVGAANRRLADMSSGRYQLQHSDALAARGAASGLGIVVFDAFTGRERPAQSLSGGETFLSSLALALGLAEVVTARAGGIRLDTLFIDEGFGSLDADTLDIAMRTLDELRAGGRTVGMISHVEAMQEQISAQLTVSATPEGPSVIRVRSAG